MSTYKPRREACKLLGVHYHTLYRMAEEGEIDTIKIRNKQMYNVEKYMTKNGGISGNRKKICYCRVSSQKQKEDLKRQEEYMKNKYPTYEIISDIGSGLNFERKGLNKIIDMGIKGEIEILVVAYKDRLARFGYELIEKIIKEYSKGEIKVENKKEEETSTEEMSKDIVAIMNVYVAKMNGLRKYKREMVEEIRKTKIVKENKETEKIENKKKM